MSAQLPPLLDKLVLENGVNVRVRYVGPTTAPVALLLHGWPEHWFAWRHQIVPLLQAGWRLVIPDLRGFARSDKPEKLQDYRYDVAAQDVLHVMDALGVGKAALVGHDIGGVVGWYAASAAPERFTHFVAISAPHPSVSPDIMRSPAGLSGLYMQIARFPGVAEALLARGRYAPLKQLLHSNVRPGHITDAELATYEDEWAREFGMRAVLDWYRCAAKHPSAPKADKVSVPTVVVWGANDAITRPELAEASAQRGAGGRVVKIADAGHWPHLDQPSAVADAIVAHIGQHAVIKEQTRPPRW